MLQCCPLSHCKSVGTAPEHSYGEASTATRTKREEDMVSAGEHRERG